MKIERKSKGSEIRECFWKKGGNHEKTEEESAEKAYSSKYVQSNPVYVCKFRGKSGNSIGGRRAIKLFNKQLSK